MPRILGVELQNNHRIDFALTDIYGVGSALAEKIVKATKVPADKRVKDLTEDEVLKLQKEVETHPVEGDLRRMVTQSIRRLEEIGSYRGLRHKRGLPVRGQRTRSNARTKRGKRQTIGAMKKEARVQMAQKPQGQETGK